MRKSDHRLARILAIAGMLWGLATYFDWGATAMLWACCIISTIVAIVAIGRTFGYDGCWYDHNPAEFWPWYSLAWGAIIVAMFYIIGFGHEDNNLTRAIVYGCLFQLIPTLGVFLGNTGRIFVGKTSVFWCYNSIYVRYRSLKTLSHVFQKENIN